MDDWQLVYKTIFTAGSKELPLLLQSNRLIAVAIYQGRISPFLQQILLVPGFGKVEGKSFFLSPEKQILELSNLYRYRLFIRARGRGELTLYKPRNEGLATGNHLYLDTALEPDRDYIAASTNPLSLTLPDSAPIGSKISVLEDSTGGFTLLPQPSQIIRFGNIVTSPSGYIRNTEPGDRISLQLVANNLWLVIDSFGNFEVI